jgi:hypothetical protein
MEADGRSRLQEEEHFPFVIGHFSFFISIFHLSPWTDETIGERKVLENSQMKNGK